MLVTTTLTTAVWLTVTLLTRPESDATLQTFFDRVRPAPLGWRKFADIAYARGNQARPSNEARHSDPEHRVGSESPHFESALNSAAQDPADDHTLRWNFIHWVLGFTLIYAMLFGLGDLLFGRMAAGLGLVALSAACLGTLFWSLNRRGWSVWK
jgi:hypothetical protein